MYCSIEEAWQDNTNSVVHKHKYYGETNNSIQINNNVEKNNLIEKNHDLNNLSCKYILEHLENCNKCKMDFYKKHYLYNILSVNPQMKETIIIFLIGILILLILNLLYK